MLLSLQNHLVFVFRCLMVRADFYIHPYLLIEQAAMEIGSYNSSEN